MKSFSDATLTVLCIFTTLFAIMFMVLIYYPSKETQALTVISGLFTGYAGALTLYLRSDKAEAKEVVDSAALKAKNAVDEAADKASHVILDAAVAARIEKDKV